MLFIAKKRFFYICFCTQDIILIIGYSINGGDDIMARMKKNPSRAGVSAASVKGNAGPTVETGGSGKVNSQNNQYKKK